MVAPDRVQQDEEIEEEKGRALVIASKKAGVGTEPVHKVKKILDNADEELKKKLEQIKSQ